MAKAATANAKQLYDVHPGVAMMQKWVAELKEKTGRTLEEWLALVKKEGPKDENARREWLKTKHKLGTNSAWWIAERAEDKESVDDNPEAYLKSAVQYVQEQYSGAKEKLRPIYDELLQLGKSIGEDVKACPCKTIVPLYREHVVCANQAKDKFANRFGLCVDALQGEAAEAADRHRWNGKKGPDYTPD